MTKELCSGVASWLRARDIPARTGWSGRERERIGAPFVLVSLRRCDALSGGFQEYLGELYNENTGAWEEFYGKKLELELGLDLYAPEAASEDALQELAEKLVQALTLEQPQGLRVGEITCGGIEWDRNQRCLRQEITAKCTAWLRAVCADSGEFLDFELRGGWKI